MNTKLNILTTNGINEQNSKLTEIDTQNKVLFIVENNFAKVLFNIRNDFFTGVDIEVKYNSYFQDTSFIKFFNEYVSNNYPKIVEESNDKSHNELYFLLYLFSLKNGIDVYKNGEIYDENKLEILIKQSFLNISNIKDLNGEKGVVEVENFSRLCGIFNILCVLNQNNSLRKNFIFIVIDIISSYIKDLLKLLNQKSFQDENIIKSLNYILGLFKLNYSYVEYVDLPDENRLDLFLKTKKYNLEKTINGYNDCLMSDFGNNLQKKEIIDRVLYINISYIISIVLLKIDQIGIEEKDILKNKTFVELIEIFLNQIKKVGNKDINFVDIKTLKQDLNIIFIENYKGFNKFNNKYFEKKQEFLSDFLAQFNGANFTNKVNDLEIIHHLVLFNTKLNKEISFKLIEIIIKQVPSNNINYEVISLKILNILLSRIVFFKDESIKKYLELIINYIDENKILSHLLYSYSLIYITVGYCYSFFKDKESQEKSFECYAKFKQIFNKDFDFKKYGINIEQYFLNIGINKALKYDMIQGDFEDIKSDLSNSKKQVISNNIISKLGEGRLEEYFFDFKKNKVDFLIGKLDSFLFNNKDAVLNLDDLSKKIEEILLNIFYGLVGVKIIDIHSMSKINYLDKDKNYKDFSIVNGYVLRFIYHISFEEDFESMYYNSSNNGLYDDSLDIKQPPKGGILGDIFYKLKLFLEGFNEKNKLYLALVADFEKSLFNGDLVHNFQGIFDEDQKAIKYEMLSRVNSGNLIDGKKYFIKDYIDAITLLKRYDLLKKLIKYTIDNRVLFINKNPEFEVSINIEYSDIVDEGLIIYLESLVLGGVKTKNITFELIEGRWENNDLVIKNLKRLKSCGYKIAMDDFGAGESSINRLITLFDEKVIDFLKIDAEIIKRLNLEENISIKNKILSIIGFEKSSDGDVESIVKMIVSICDNHNVGVVAEYIENRYVFEKLQKLGVKYFQGYFLGKPVAKEKL